MSAESYLKESLLDFLICPYCQEDPTSRLEYVRDRMPPALRCVGCNRSYPIIDGIIDFCPGFEKRTGTGLAQKFMEHKAVVSVYENYFRPAFTRLGSPIKYDEEIQWLSAIPTGGIPVTAILDLACGTGKYTRLLNRLYNPEIIFAVDISLPMLQKSVACAREEKIENIIHIRGDAGALPLRTRCLQRVNCFGALHLFPDVTGAIHEIGRVSAAQAVFSCLTSRKVDRFSTRQTVFSKLFSFHFFDENRLEQDLQTAGFDSMAKNHKNMVLLFFCRKKDLA
jgi:ubiquinone/menaquinone biosynthesis C-methylase UbiE/uncharacterized protein YbaR (Trm112 family)